MLRPARKGDGTVARSLKNGEKRGRCLSFFQLICYDGENPGGAQTSRRRTAKAMEDCFVMYGGRCHVLKELGWRQRGERKNKNPRFEPNQ